MRHGVAGKNLTRTPAHFRAMRRNMAQSLFQYGQIETTLKKAKEIRPFVERLITIANKNTLQARQRVASLLGERAIIEAADQEAYDGMSSTQRAKVMTNRGGRHHRAGRVPASYNKKKIPFVAKSIVFKLLSEVAPKFKDRAGGYTRIIRLAKLRIGDNTELAILQLLGNEQPSSSSGNVKKPASRRRLKTATRIRLLEGKKPAKRSGERKAAAKQSPAGGGEAGAAQEPQA